LHRDMVYDEEVMPIGDTEQSFGAICERLERATLAALDPIVFFPPPI
jgi:hypothetical protein